MGQRTFDLKEVIRDDFLLGIPTHPRCDIEGERKVCPKVHIMIEADQQEPMEEPALPDDDVWGALDDLK